MRIVPVYTMLVLSILVPVQAAAQFTSRTECWPNGSAMGARLQAVKEQGIGEERLTRKHQELVDLVTVTLNDRLQENSYLPRALQSQQAAWLGHNAAECELAGELSASRDGWASFRMTICMRNHTEQRLRTVLSAVSCIKRLPKQAGVFNLEQCVRKLARLTDR